MPEKKAQNSSKGPRKNWIIQGQKSIIGQAPFPFAKKVKQWHLEPSIVSFNAIIETMKRAQEWKPGLQELEDLEADVSV